MIQVFLFISALAGTSYAAWCDLRTTEVSDLVSLAMAVIGIGSSFLYSFFSGEWSFLISSLMVGTSFLVFGLLLYFIGMWGGADALILGATGYLLHFVPELFSPTFSSAWPYQVSFLFNLFLVGAFYSMIYSVYLAYEHELFADFFKEVEDYKFRIAFLGAFYFFVSLALPLILGNYYRISISLSSVLYRSLVSLGAVLGLFILYIFFSTVQKNYMEERINVKDLEPGEVIADNLGFINDRDEQEKRGILSKFRSIFPSRIRGLTEGEVEEIKGKREEVTVRRGVTFIVSFPIAIILTYIVGDILYNLLMIIY